MIFINSYRFGVGYCAEAIALFARMDVQPSIALKQLINKTIVDLKAASLWTTCHDLLYFFNLHTEQASLLNWINTSYNATKVGSPTFTPKIGITTASATTSYLNCNYNPANNATNFLQTKRPIVDININFVKELQDMENRLHK